MADSFDVAEELNVSISADPTGAVHAIKWTVQRSTYMTLETIGQISDDSSRFGIPVKRLGLVAAYDEIAALLRLVSVATALEILLEGRVFGAAEAFEKDW